MSRQLLILSAVLLALTLWELWFWAVAAILWCYFSRVGVLDDSVVDRTKYGVAYLLVGTVILILTHGSGGLWWIGTGMVLLGAILLAMEPSWSSN